MPKQKTPDFPRSREIWLATMSGHSVIGGCRPVVIVGCDRDGGLVSVVPFSTELTYPQKLSHFFAQGQGLDGLSRGLAEHITTLPRRALLRRTGRLSDPFDLLALDHALALHLGLPVQSTTLF